MRQDNATGAGSVAYGKTCERRHSFHIHMASASRFHKKACCYSMELCEARLMPKMARVRLSVHTSYEAIALWNMKIIANNTVHEKYAEK